jgi:hypothetical protein
MDWAKAIEINQTALSRILAGLFAMAGIAGGGTLSHLPQSVYDAILQVLRPAESAVRRLIVIAARGLVLEPVQMRAGSKGLARPSKTTVKRKAKSGGRISFQLFDSRKQFAAGLSGRSRRRYTTLNPRIYLIDASPLIPLFQTPVQPASVPSPVPATVDTVRLGRRLAAVRMALENLPKQARRLVRWQAKRNTLLNPKFFAPLRPGRPPGHRQRPRYEVDHVLKECHGLARLALQEDTS